MSIKAICFDLDGVFFTPRGKKSFHQALSVEFGADQDKVDTFMGNHPAMNALVRGNIANDVFFNEMRQFLGINVSDEDITSRWVRDYEIDREVQEAVHAAREQGYLTCVCTNNNDIRLSALENQFGFFKDFDVVVSSHMVGACKPSPAIFQALLHDLGVKPNELVYADDNPDRIDGACKLGIDAFVFENFDQYLDELQKRNIHLIQ